MSVEPPYRRPDEFEHVAGLPSGVSGQPRHARLCGDVAGLAQRELATGLDGGGDQQRTLAVRRGRV